MRLDGLKAEFSRRLAGRIPRGVVAVVPVASIGATMCPTPNSLPGGLALDASTVAITGLRPHTWEGNGPIDSRSDSTERGDCRLLLVSVLAG
jgi:hypothetical protein